ncbi:hypothetical protein [Brevundimonas sp.]|uniref:hypothetical protein n=1 Tax=Brevundimonas sp. TaxID=1871086 RepID=UPI00289638F5|nr:hypothetical protein [Brevundimonas sp.]
MNSYFCIVNMPGVPAREICVLNAGNDAEARDGLASVAAEWIGFDTILLYQGERLIEVASNPHLGFPQDSLLAGAPDHWDKAA